MKKLQLLILAFLLTIPFYGQETRASKSKEQYVYAEIISVIRFVNSKLTISVDFGQNSKLFERIHLSDSLGKVITFSSMIDALNKMESLGWEFVQAYVAPEPGKNEYHWMIKYNIADLKSEEIKIIGGKNK